jgi:hypothetical protein
MESTNDTREPLFPEEEAKLKVPPGDYCYQTVHTGGLDMDEYQRNLKAQFPDDSGARFLAYLENTKRVYCPYWSVTDYGTVKCGYLGIEAVGMSGKSSKEARKHFGSEEAIQAACTGGTLGDALKECNVNNSH